MRERVYEVVYSSDEVHVAEWTAKRTVRSLIVYWSTAPGSPTRRFDINSVAAKRFYRSADRACDAARTMAAVRADVVQAELDAALRVLRNAEARVRIARTLR